MNCIEGSNWSSTYFDNNSLNMYSFLVVSSKIYKTTPNRKFSLFVLVWENGKCGVNGETKQSEREKEEEEERAVPQFCRSERRRRKEGGGGDVIMSTSSSSIHEHEEEQMEAHPPPASARSSQCRYRSVLPRQTDTTGRTEISNLGLKCWLTKTKHIFFCLFTMWKPKQFEEPNRDSHLHDLIGLYPLTRSFLIPIMFKEFHK